MGIRWGEKDCRLFEFGFFDVLPDGGIFHEFFVGGFMSVNGRGGCPESDGFIVLPEGP